MKAKKASHKKMGMKKEMMEEKMEKKEKGKKKMPMPKHGNFMIVIGGMKPKGMKKK